MLTGGVIKVLHVPFQVEHWRHYEYPLWFLSQDVSKSPERLA